MQDPHRIPMHPALNRRSFLAACGAWGIGSALGDNPAGSPALGDQLHDMINRDVPGFFKGGALLCVIADPHILLGTEMPKFRTERWDDRLIDEINSLSHLFTDVCVAGDLISYHSMTPGIPRYPIHEVWAREEFGLAKRELGRFDPSMRLWAVPGNHDTIAAENSAELWQEMLGIPPYRRATLGGVPVLFLNSGNGGMLGAGQLAWLKGECATIPPDQEILIVAHHPVFYALREEAALKRVLCDLLGGRRGRVWIVSGHGHRFDDVTYLHRGTMFTQIEVTSANPLFSDDKRSPGYVALALHEGRVAKRVFRSLLEPGFTEVFHLPRATPPEVEFQFDAAPFRIDTYEHGARAEAGRLISFQGVDVGSYIAYCKQCMLRVVTAGYRTPPAQVLLSGTIPAGVNPECAISASGPSGPWTQVPFPSQRGSGLFPMTIPRALRSAPELHLRITTGLRANIAGFSFTGWAVTADEGDLTGYQRWLARWYGNLLDEPASREMAITPGLATPNLVTFAFALAPDAPSTLPKPLFGGMPKLQRVSREVLDLRFARRRSASPATLVCGVEHSADLATWLPVDERAMRIRPLNEAWEEVGTSRIRPSGGRIFLRVKVNRDDSRADGFTVWQASVKRPGGTRADANRNGTDDLLEYAFSLPESGAIPRYDPARLGHVGLPQTSFRVALVTRILFTRPTAASRSGVECVLESSNDLLAWSRVPTWTVQESILRSSGGWEEVEAAILDEHATARFYRISARSLDTNSP